MSVDFSFLTLATAVANFILGTFVLSRGKSKPLNISFFLFTTIDAIWALSNFYFEKFHKTIFVFQSQYATGALTLIAAIIWIFFLIDESHKKNKIILVSILGFLVFSTPYIDGLVIRAISETTGGGFSFEKGPLFDFYGIILFLILTILFYRLISAEKHSIGLKKIQLRYVLAGITIFALVAITFGLILPLFGFSTIVAFDAQSSFLWVILTSYAIIRHRLLDIRFVITRSLIFAFLVTFVALSFILVLFVSAQFFGDSPASRNTIAFFVAIIIVFGLDPLKLWLSRVTDKIFFKARVDYQSLLRQLSEALSFEINRDTLVRKIRGTLQEGLKVKFAATLLRKEKEGKTENFEALPDLLSENPNLSVINNSPLVRFLREHKHFSIVESLERKIEDTKENEREPLIESKKEFERMGASLITPIFAQGHLIAILVLGPKLSGDSFTNDDTQLIEVLSPQIGSAIQKANLFEEVRQFSESLKVKVAEATAELRERNVSLQTLQNITKEVTRTLDFNKVVQQIADAVSLELGYVGAILAFLDDDGKTSRARAITDTPLTRRAIKLLPKHFSKYETDISDLEHTNLGTVVYTSGQIRMASSFAEVVSPPLPKLLANTIQKLIGVKTMVIVPINSEGKTIGVIEIGVKKAADDISKGEIDTMQAIADELGVVSRNLKLFEQLRKTNAQLEVANEHLKELDKAKSEFVSIASHQLRTPMTGIMGYLSMMTQGDFGAIKPEHTEILKNLLSESQRMIRLINQFLNVSKIEAGKFTYTKKPTQIETLIDTEIRELNKAATDKKLKLIWKKPAEALPAPAVDSDKMQDVILNLIDNAIKYTAKGSITVTAESVDGHIQVRVKDTGIGIKPQDATELFNKFVRGSGIAQIHPDGSGLGLFIAKSIIDAHGGRIWAESEGEGKGSAFQFIIPINPPAEAEAEHARSAAAHVVSTKRT